MDQGRPRQIAVFSLETERPAGRTPPPSFFSNQPTDGRRLTAVILLDCLNTRFEDQGRAKRRLIQSLDQLGPDARVAVYTLEREIRVLHAFGDSAELLPARLESFVPQSGPELDASDRERGPAPGIPRAGASTGTANSRLEAEFYRRRRIEYTLKALSGIGLQLSSVPGRKILIWFSAGFPLTMGPDGAGFRMFSPEMTRTMAALNDANVAVYPIDPRGLPLDADRQTIDTMVEIAERTGGRAFYNRNDLAFGVQSAVEESLVSYTLGFYVDDEGLRSEFRPLQVRVSRPGVTLRYRQGYYTEPPAAKKAASLAQLIKDAVAGPLDATSLPVVASVDLVGGNPSRVLVKARLELPSLQISQHGARWRGDIEILFAQLDDRGKLLTMSTDTLELRLLRQTYLKLLREGLTHGRELDLKPNAVLLRLVAIDKDGGVVGSLTVPLQRLLSPR